MWAKVQAFHMRCQCRILSIKCNDFIPNVTVAATSGLDSIINIVRARQLGLFGHVARFSRDVPASNILSICCASRNGGAQVDDLEPPGLITSLPTPAWLWPIHYLWHKIVCSGGQLLWPQRLHAP